MERIGWRGFEAETVIESTRMLIRMCNYRPPSDDLSGSGAAQ